METNIGKKSSKKVSSIDLLEKRILYLNGEIDDCMAKEIIKNLIKLDLCCSDDITLYINSPGGSVSAGLAIFDVMNMIKSDVSTVCVGKCASMASVLLVNGTKGKRYILPNAEVMVHEVSSGTYGKVTEMQDDINHSKSVNKKLWKLIADKTNMSVTYINKIATRKDAWLSSTKALNYGFVDEILDGGK